MENKELVEFPPKPESHDEVPPLIEFIIGKQVDGFDDNRSESTFSPNFVSSSTGNRTDEVQNHLFQSQRTHSLSISMPPSPLQSHVSNTKEILYSGDCPPFSSAEPKKASAKQVKFLSQPLTMGAGFPAAVGGGASQNSPQWPQHQPRNLRSNKLSDGRYNSFKTWSGKLERQLSHLHLRGRQQLSESESNVPHTPEVKNLHVDRYFDALEGPELETLRDSEEILLPEDKQWPFLLRFPVSSFGICLGIGSQAVLWKTLATSVSTEFLHISLRVNIVLWIISVTLALAIFIIYSMKIIFYFEAVRREYYHPIRINFFFAPWIAILFLCLGLPPSISKTIHSSLWYIFMAPIFFLELKIYGQWMSGGQRRLSKVANPSNHLSVVGNFVGALLGAQMGLTEGPIFFFAIGLAHYIVLFVTLYQRLPTNETLPKELHPVFFLFVAAPSVASMAWAKIQGSFDYGSRISYFIAMFLYFSLAVRVNFFRGFKFSLAWWAYTFPMTGASVATLRYANEVDNVVTKSLSVLLCAISMITVMALLVSTIIHAFVLRDLFPNDIAIAISDRKPMMPPKWYPGSASSENIENYLKFSCSGTEPNNPSTMTPKDDQEINQMQIV